LTAALKQDFGMNFAIIKVILKILKFRWRSVKSKI